MWLAVRRRAARRRASAPVLIERAECCEDRVARAVVPREPRAHLRAAEHRQVAPAVVIEIGPILPVRAAEDAVAPARVQRLRQPYRPIGAAVIRPVHEHLVFGGLRPPRYEVDDAADRRHAVERGGDPLDHLDLREIHRRNLQDADRA